MSIKHPEDYCLIGKEKEFYLDDESGSIEKLDNFNLYLKKKVFL